MTGSIPSNGGGPSLLGSSPWAWALATGAGLATLALVTAALMFGAALAGIITAYLVVSICYSLVLKRLPLVELACVASGFALRAVAGGAVAHVTISPWFLMVASFGSLLIVAGKRSVELSVMKEQRELHRSALAAYPAAFLRSVRMLAMSVTVTTYCLWAFERAGGLGPAERAEDIVWFELSIIPFVLAVLVVELAIEQGRGGSPKSSRSAIVACRCSASRGSPCWSAGSTHECRLPARVAGRLGPVGAVRRDLGATGVGGPTGGSRGSPARHASHGARAVSVAPTVTPLECGGGLVVDCTGVNRVLDLDLARATIRAEAGVSVDELLRLLVPRGFFPPVTPGTRLVTLGGAIASDVHGKNHHVDGTVSRHLEYLRIATPTGLVECSPTQHGDVFWATCGGMGLTGLVLEAVLRLVPIETSTMLVDTERADDLDACMGRLSEDQDAYRYSVAWVDGLAAGRRLGSFRVDSGEPRRQRLDLPVERGTIRCTSTSRGPGESL